MKNSQNLKLNADNDNQKSETQYLKSKKPATY